MNEVFQALSLVNSSSLYSGHGGIIYSKAFFLAEENFRKQWLATVSLDLDSQSPELIAGLGGLLLAVLKYSPTESLPAEDLILDAILSQIEFSEHGCYWIVDVEQILGPIRQAVPQNLLKMEVKVADLFGAVNLGFSHGLAGLVFVLSQYALLRPSRLGKVVPVLAGLSEYLIYASDRTPSGDIPAHFFNHEYVKVFKSGVSQQAWCYGTPGISMALLWAAIALQREDYRSKAWELFLIWNKNMKKKMSLDNPFFCHGYAGLADICRFFYNETHRKEAREQWLYWLQVMKTYKAVSSKSRGFYEGGLLEGFLGVAAVSQCDEPKNWESDWSILFGTAKITT
ncbi:MAG: lanthionine synthetase LanC family protein [Pseudobdellovibrionaceae bacterium]